jgi:hypothetical protein
MKSLTIHELQQLLDYAQQCENDGWYWGNKEHFRKRHDNIKAWLNTQIDIKLSKKLTGSAFKGRNAQQLTL